jgi:aryl-phospho-beta-D-glucosidase BglC (GH1 family)
MPRRFFALCLSGCLAQLAACGQTPPPSQHSARLTDHDHQQVPQALYTSAGNIVDSQGKVVSLNGFSYFGFNNQQTMVDGLWGGPAIGLDFASIVYRQQLLGFNAVRLPFSFKDLLNLKPRNFTQNCSLPSPTDVAKSVLAKGQSLPATVPAQAFKPNRPTGACNEYLPNDSVWNRFKWVVTFYAHNGFYVLIDNHLREDTSALENSGQWASNYAKLVSELSTDPVVRDHLMVDVLNEPDQYGLQWQPQNGKPGLGNLYLQAMDAISAVAPRALFFIEGTGQGSLQSNWGDGYDTNPSDISQLGLSDPRPFFTALRTKSYHHRVVLAPHVYGPAVTTNNQAFSGPALFNRLSSSFGSLTQQGFCTGGTCDTYPVAIGEFGSNFTDPRDVATMTDLSLYLRNVDAGNDGKHRTIRNWFYWSWNADSGDTGGLVQNDWVTLQPNKVTFLQALGLKLFSR